MAVIGTSMKITPTSHRTDAMNPQGLLRYGHTYELAEKRAALMLQLYGVRV